MALGFVFIIDKNSSPFGKLKKSQKTNFANICQLINNSICCINDLNIQIKCAGKIVGLGCRLTIAWPHMKSSKYSINGQRRGSKN